MDKEPGPLTAFLRSLPPWAEMVFVISVAFGLFISISLDIVTQPPDPVAPAPPSTDNYFVLMAIELLQATIIVWFLRAREWTAERLGVKPADWRDIVHTIVLLVVAVGLNYGAYHLAIAIRPDLHVDTAGIDDEGIPGALAIAFSAMNAAYEELFVCAYIVAAWRGGDVWTAIAISALVRLSYGLAQGPLAIVLVFPMGVLFAWYFASQRRVLPLILTNAGLSIIAFWQHGA